MQRTPQAYAYARVSDSRQTKTASLHGQLERCRQYYHHNLQPQGVEWAGVEYDNFGVSGYHKHFWERPAAKRIINRIQSGDHLIVDTYDRLSRTVVSLGPLLEWFQRYNIAAHIISLKLDLSTAVGQGMASMIVAMGQAESEARSRRILESGTYNRRKGRATGGKPPAGCAYVWKGMGKERRRLIVWDPEKRALMQQIVRWREEDNMSWPQISETLERDLAECNGRTYHRGINYRMKWYPATCQNAYIMEKYYQDKNIQDPREIPIQSHKLAREHARRKGLLSPINLHPSQFFENYQGNMNGQHRTASPVPDA